MLNKLLKNTAFRSEIKDFFKKNEDELIDILLFGSAVRGKEKPGDIDILIIYKQKKNIELTYLLKKRLEKYYKNIQITPKAYGELFTAAFPARESILSEGYSLIQDTFISKGMGYRNMALFRYDLKKFNKSERMRFYYSLYGRKKQEKGMLNELNAIKFADTILLCPIEKQEHMKEYLNNWHINYIEFSVLIPERMTIKH